MSLPAESSAYVGEQVRCGHRSYAVSACTARVESSGCGLDGTRLCRRTTVVHGCAIVIGAVLDHGVSSRIVHDDVKPPTVRYMAGHALDFSAYYWWSPCPVERYASHRPRGGPSQLDLLGKTVRAWGKQRRLKDFFREAANKRGLEPLEPATRVRRVLEIVLAWNVDYVARSTHPNSA